VQDNDVNAAQFQAFRREVLGVDSDGSLVLGEREPLDEAEE